MRPVFWSKYCLLSPWKLCAAHFHRSCPALLGQNEELELQYKSCYARILDSKRRFLEAATRYYELSQIGKRVIGGRLVSCKGRCKGWFVWAGDFEMDGFEIFQVFTALHN